jgi:multidrug efflux pump subunit AcrA (membrane-fusion protein)
VKVDRSTRDFILKIYKDNKISLEGNILKVIEPESEDTEFAEYLTASTDKDKVSRRRRLDITKQIQNQNKDLLLSQEENQKLMEDLKNALTEAEKSKTEAMEAMKKAEAAKELALTDLDVLQKRTQTELIGTIVKVALYVIIGVGVTVTTMYIFAIASNVDTQIIGSTWANMLGILLTNAFSIVGTIMGVKYASEKSNKIS